MTNVLDSLVLELGIDSSRFTKGQRDAVDSLRKFEDQAERSGTAIEAQSKKSLELFSVIKRELLGVIGIAFGGVEAKRFLNFVTGLDASTGRLARTLGEGASELSAWQGAFEQIGGSAESANAALSGLSGEMSRFRLTGQSSILPVLSRLGISLYDQNRNLKTASELWLELADAVHGMDPRQATAFLQMIPGANQDMINLLLQGRAAVETYLAAARAAGGTTKENAQAAYEYQQQLNLLERQATSLGRGLLGSLMPSLNAILARLREKIRDPTGGMSLGDFLTTMPSVSIDKGSSADVFWRGLKGEYGNDYGRFFRDLYAGFGNNGGTEAATRAEGIAKLKAAFAAQAGAGKASVSINEREAYIRKTATELGIDPNVAMAVARSEGLNSYVGDRGSSFGDFQLHYGGIAPGMMQPGLGDSFTKKTGLDARNPRNWRAADRFALEHARDHGWGAWRGWRGAPFAGIAASTAAPGGAGSRSTVINVGGVTVNSSRGDADGIARDIDGALRRSLVAGSANSGPQ